MPLKKTNCKKKYLYIPDALLKKYGYGALTKAAEAIGEEPTNLNKRFQGKINPNIQLLFKMAEGWDMDFMEVVAMFYPKEVSAELLREKKRAKRKEEMNE